jgi:hypothetical protein
LNDLISSVGATCAGVNAFNGSTDNVRVYGAALGASRIERLYAEEKTKYDNLSLADFSSKKIGPPR